MRIILAVIMIFSFSLCHGQHHPLYSQYIFNGFVLNPAYTGFSDGLTAMVHYRDQWSGFDGAPSTLTLSAHSVSKDQKLSSGLIVMHDRHGLDILNDVNGSFAYRLETSAGKFGLGLSLGLSHRTFDKGSLNTNDANDDAFLKANNSELNPKIGFGAFYHHKNFFAGLSIPQWLLSSEESELSVFLQRTIYFHAGFRQSLSESISIKPSILLRYIGNAPLQLDINTTVSYKEMISTGVSYRTSGAVIFILEYKWSNFSFGYAYDHILSELSQYSFGSHELMVRYNLPYKVNARDPRGFN